MYPRMTPATMAMRMTTACGIFFFMSLASRKVGSSDTRITWSGWVSDFGACPVPQMQTPNLVEVGRLTCRALAMTYFLTGNPQYHRRGVVSRSCSGWEGVGPTRYGRQEFWNSKVVSGWVYRANRVERGTPITAWL